VHSTAAAAAPFTRHGNLCNYMLSQKTIFAAPNWHNIRSQGQGSTQLKSSIPIEPKVGISPKCLTLGVKAEIEK
jgi:hypothetical protein